MAGLSYPFDSGPGSAITEDQWSSLMRDAVGTGVHEGAVPGPLGSELEVFSLTEPGLIYVRSGRASITGFHYQQGSTETLAVTANASTTQDRIDAVVLRLDLTTNAITLVVKLGAPSTTPVPPAVAANELLLATCKVQKNSSTVLSGEVTDRRSFVGRRMGVSDTGGDGRQGDIQYSPTLDEWSGVKAGGSNASFAMWADLNEHEEASDPHPQYLTAAEGNVTATTGSLSFDPNFSLFSVLFRALNLPGGYKIVLMNIYVSFNGATNTGEYTIATISDPALRPSLIHRFVAHQWKFANSTDDIPLMIAVKPDGSITSSGQTNLMGGALIVCHGMWFKGAGV